LYPSALRASTPGAARLVTGRAIDLCQRGLPRLGVPLENMDERKFTPKFYETKAKELRGLAKQMTHAVNVAMLVKQAEQLEAKAADMRRTSGVRKDKELG